MRAGRPEGAQVSDNTPDQYLSRLRRKLREAGSHYDGPGVPEAFVDELFQPGRRADSGDGHDGAGLGLPLARRLARAVGGEVSYDPDHTPGARFTVSLPAG